LGETVAGRLLDATGKVQGALKALEMARSMRAVAYVRKRIQHAIVGSAKAVNLDVAFKINAPLLFTRQQLARDDCHLPGTSKAQRQNALTR